MPNQKTLENLPKYLLLILLLLVLSCTKSPTYQQLIEKTPWGEEVFTVPQFKETIYSIKDHQAVNKPGFNNQQQIQNAINTCSSHGGGMVLIPEGVWETSYLELKSHVNLHLEEGAVLSFSDSIPLYAVPTFTRWEGIECMNYHPLIYARDQKNIAITGKGKIVGNGRKWWDMVGGNQKISLSKLYDQVQAGIPPEERNCLDFTPHSYLRPSFVQFINCENVLVDSFEIGSGPMWTLHFIYCENVIATNLRVITTGRNNDGIIPDASKKVLIDNCYFSTGDDCIVIKSGLNEDGWRVGKASERIIVKNCSTKQGHGGVVIGSEMSGGVKNVYAYDCDFSHTDRGLRIKSMRGRGGIVENLWFKNIRMDSIRNEAILINMNYAYSSIEPRTDSVPVFRNLNYEHITSTNSGFCMRVEGLPNAKIEGVSVKNMKATGEYGIQINNAINLTLDSVNITSKQSTPIMLDNIENAVFQNVDCN